MDMQNTLSWVKIARRQMHELGEARAFVAAPPHQRRWRRSQVYVS